MQNKKKAKKKKIGKANPILYSIVHAVLKRKFVKKYNIHFDNEIVKDIKGPAIVVATHTCDEDHILSALTLYPIRPTYIVSEHFMHNPSTARLLKLMHVITKRMFTSDAATIMNIMRAKRENAVIVIFPEGRLSCYGHSLPVADGTAELIKTLGIDLYYWKADGAYLTFPKWRDKGDSRPGRINASVKLLLSSDEVKAKDVAEIKEITEKAILHDDELAMQGIEYKSEDIARGVERIIYKCPNCLEEGKISESDGHIRCECGLDATLDSCYKLSGAPFGSINEWFEWQQNSIDLESDSLFSKARLGCCGCDGFMDCRAGEGEIYLDKNVFKLSGTLHGKKIDFSVPPERIRAFPVTPGDHFDIYHDGELIYVYPDPNPNDSVKWVSFLDKLMATKKAEESDKTTATV